MVWLRLMIVLLYKGKTSITIQQVLEMCGFEIYTVFQQSRFSKIRVAQNFTRCRLSCNSKLYILSCSTRFFINTDNPFSQKSFRLRTYCTTTQLSQPDLYIYLRHHIRKHLFYPQRTEAAVTINILQDLFFAFHTYYNQSTL